MICAVRLLAALTLLVPLTASATIYKWTEEDGHVVIANRAPGPGARNVQVVMEDDKPAPAAARTRELEDRISRLERQVQAMHYVPPAPTPPPPAYPVSAPPPVPDYYSAPSYYPPDYYPPAYYPPPYYAYPFAVFPARIVRRARFFSAPRFASFHHAGIRHR
jgi:Domain of unknown function (DUF4124)